MSAIYLVRPKADQDLEEEAFYLANEASPGVGHRFLYAAHETFGLLAAQPRLGWPARLKQPQLADVRVFRVRGFERILVLYRPCRSEGSGCLKFVFWVRHPGLARQQVVEIARPCSTPT